jgi:hypothetical protein
MYGCTSPLDPIVRQANVLGLNVDVRAAHGLLATNGKTGMRSSGNVRFVNRNPRGGARISAACPGMAF